MYIYARNMCSIGQVSITTTLFLYEGPHLHLIPMSITCSRYVLYILFPICITHGHSVSPSLVVFTVRFWMVDDTRALRTPDTRTLIMSTQTHALMLMLDQSKDYSVDYTFAYVKFQPICMVFKYSADWVNGSARLLPLCRIVCGYFAFSLNVYRILNEPFE